MTTTSTTRPFVWLQMSLGVVAVITSAIAAFVVSPSLHKAKQAEVAQAATAARAETSLSAVASSTLQRIQLIDGQLQSLTDGDAPTLYLWKGGLKQSPLSREDTLKLSTLLNERRFLVGDSGPLFSYSPPLFRYFCDHSWFVIAESAPNAVAVQQELTQLRKRDPRFATAGTVDSNSPNNPNKGIAIGFFTSRDQAPGIGARNRGSPF